MKLLKNNWLFISIVVGIFAGMYYEGSWFVGITAAVATFFVLGFILYIHEERKRNKQRRLLENPPPMPEITEENLYEVAKWFVLYWPGLIYPKVVDINNDQMMGGIVDILHSGLSVKEDKDLLGSMIWGIVEARDELVGSIDDSLPKYKVAEIMDRIGVSELCSTILDYVFEKTHGESWENWKAHQMELEEIREHPTYKKMIEDGVDPDKAAEMTLILVKEVRKMMPKLFQ